MIEPTLALQTAVRTSLIADSAVTALVQPSSIRSGWIRPGNEKAITFSSGQAQFLGRASGSQFLARVYLDLHIWAIEDGADSAQQIGFAVCQRLFDAPSSTDVAFDEWHRPGMIWVRDPQPERAFTHGIAQIECVLRWSA